MRRLGEEAAAARLQYSYTYLMLRTKKTGTIRASASDVFLSPQLLDHVGTLIGFVRRRTRPLHLPDL
jgi:hypothetical protein